MEDLAKFDMLKVEESVTIVTSLIQDMSPKEKMLFMGVVQTTVIGSIIEDSNKEQSK